MTLDASATLHGKPRYAFAYTPTSDPRSWRLPYLTADGAPDPQTLSISATALTEGADLPDIALPVIRAKMRQAFKRMGTDFEAMPTAVREASAEDELGIEASLPDFDPEAGAASDARLDSEVETAYKHKKKGRAATYHESLYDDIASEEASSSDHPFGAWRGGKSSSGGGPASTKGAGTDTQRRKEMAARVGKKNVGRKTALSKRLAKRRGSGDVEENLTDAQAAAAEVEQQEEEARLAKLKKRGTSKKAAK